MAFDLNGWARIGGAQTVAPVINTYLSGTDTLATITAVAYFDTRAGALKVDDLIYARGTDAGGWFRVTDITPAVGIAAI